MPHFLRLTPSATEPETSRPAQEMIAKDYANAYLFQLAKTGVANAKIEGLWENSPNQSNDLTAVRWLD